LERDGSSGVWGRKMAILSAQDEFFERWDGFWHVGSEVRVNMRLLRFTITLFA